MRIPRRLAAFVAALLLVACAAVHAPQSGDPKRTLAPTGTLRVGLFQGTITNVVKDPASGELKGIGYDLGKALAGSLGVAFEPVVYTKIDEFTDAGAKGEWDVAFLAVSEERARLFDFTRPYLEIEFGYLVPAGSRLEKGSETDRLGVRIAAVENGAPEGHLRRTLKSASLITVKTAPEALNMLKTGSADAFYAIKTNLPNFATSVPGSKILPGDSGAEPHAIAIPKSRGTPAALAAAQRFVDEATANGTVKAAIDRANLRIATIPSGRGGR